MQNDSTNPATSKSTGGRIRNDFLLIATVLALALALYLIFTFGGTGGNTVVIIVNGQRTNTYPLSENTEFTVGDEASDVFNNVVIKDGEVFISEASCPDGVCVSHRAVSKVGETVVCLPNRLVVEIE